MRQAKQKRVSVAEDHGTEERAAKRFCQSVINQGMMELGGVQAAALVLGMRSSQSSEEGCPYDPWDIQRLANMVAHGVKDNFDFSESSSHRCIWRSAGTRRW